MKPYSKEAKDFFLSMQAGVLSTQSSELPGYPTGSLVAYALDGEGNPVLQLSALAEHSKNLERNPKASLTIADVKAGDVQNSTRLTLAADALKLVPAPDEIRERYYARFPAAREYGEKLDFSFYRLRILRARYIGGLGRVVTLGPEDFR